MRRVAAAGVALLAGLLMSACPQVTAVWIAPGSTVDNLVFEFGREVGRLDTIATGVIRVHRCADSIGAHNPPGLWVVYSDPPQLLTRAKYGTSIPGLKTEYGPSRLVPDCYTVGTSGGTAVFTVEPSGAILSDRPNQK